jgi:hypothetical protein
MKLTATRTGAKGDANDAAYRVFKSNLYHRSLSVILQPLKAAMTTPVIRRCPDGHFRRVIYDLAVYIADYPEQALLSAIVSGWCPKYDCGLMSNDVLYTDNLLP